MNLGGYYTNWGKGEGEPKGIVEKNVWGYMGVYDFLF